MIAPMNDYLGWRNTAVDDTHEDWSDDDDDDNDPQPRSLVSHVHDRINHTSLCTTSHSSLTPFTVPYTPHTITITSHRLPPVMEVLALAFRTNAWSRDL